MDEFTEEEIRRDLRSFRVHYSKIRNKYLNRPDVLLQLVIEFCGSMPKVDIAGKTFQIAWLIRRMLDIEQKPYDPTH